MDFDVTSIYLKGLIAQIAITPRMAEAAFDRGLQTKNKWQLVTSVFKSNMPSSEIAYAKKVLNDLERLNELPMGWDGYDALQIPTECIDMAKGLLRLLPSGLASPEVVPNPNGTISLEWENEKGRAHLEVGSLRYSFYVKPLYSQTVPICGENEHLLSQIPPVLANMLLDGVSQGNTISDVRYPQHSRSGTYSLSGT
jgi:hypothetical protein